MSSRAPIAIAAALSAGFLSAQEGAGNALNLLNAWLAEAAPAEPAYRADLKAGGDPAGRGPGRLSGVSELLGPFTYRPKTYVELTPSERMELLRDPRFRAFLMRVREESDRGPAPSRDPARPPADRRGADYAPTPEEILKPGDLWLILPP
jgi:hypothetical protein